MKASLMVRAMFIALVFALLPGCATLESGSSDSMKAVVLVQHPDLNGGKISPTAVKEVERLSVSCLKQVAPQMVAEWRAALEQAAVSGIAGYVGGGLAGEVAFPETRGVNNFTRYGEYGGIFGAVTGAVTGWTRGSYAVAAAVGTCTEKFWVHTAKTKPEFKGVEVIVVPVYKLSGASPPALSAEDRKTLEQRSRSSSP